MLPKLLPFSFGDEPASLGESTTVQCSISLGDLPVQFFWRLNNETAEDIQGVNVAKFGKKTSVLSIDSLAEKHAGNYTCLATNKAGTTSHHAELVVNGKYLHVIPFSSSPNHSFRIFGRSDQFWRYVFFDLYCQ